MGVGHGYSVGTGGHDFFLSVLFRAVFDCLFVDELAAFVSCDFVDTGKFGLHVFARHSVFVVNYTSCPGD